MEAYKIQINERLTKVKKKIDQLFNLMFLTFHFFHSNVPVDKSHKQKWRLLFLHSSKYLRVCWRVRMRLHASNEEDCYCSWYMASKAWSSFTLQVLESGG